LVQEKFELACETLGEMASAPLIREKDVELEKGVILQEYERCFANGDNLTMKYLFERFFSGHPLGHSVLGDPSHIQTITALECRRFHNQYYHAGNMHIICGGSFSEYPDVLNIIENFFGQIRAGEPEKFDILPLEILEKQERVSIVDKSCGRDQSFLVYPFNPLSFLDGVILNLLANSLAGDMDTPLLTELREKRSLLYEKNLCRVADWPQGASFTVYLPVKSKNLEIAQQIFREVLHGLNADYLRMRQKARQIGRRSSYTGQIAVCQGVIDEIVRFGRTMSFREHSDLVDEVTLEQVFTWRDRLVETTPFMWEIKTS
jgi:predicted Zn-dependent peptidase